MLGLASLEVFFWIFSKPIRALEILAFLRLDKSHGDRGDLRRLICGDKKAVSAEGPTLSLFHFPAAERRGRQESVNSARYERPRRRDGEPRSVACCDRPGERAINQTSPWRQTSSQRSRRTKGRQGGPTPPRETTTTTSLFSRKGGEGGVKTD